MNFTLSMVMALMLTTAAAIAKDTGFPNVGTPYAVARAALLKQGLTIAPDKPHYPSAAERAKMAKKGIRAATPVPVPSPAFGEIDCWKLDWDERRGTECQALYLETRDGGWKMYVVVPIDATSGSVGEIHYPSTADGLPAIPPPLAKDVPQIKGNYFAARKVLKSLGFRPARNHNTGWPGRVCADRRCDHIVTLPEAGCSGTGAGFCTAYWIAADNRVLRVMTIWEYPQVHFAEWSTWKSLKDDFRKLPD